MKELTSRPSSFNHVAEKGNRGKGSIYLIPFFAIVQGLLTPCTKYLTHKSAITMQSFALLQEILTW